VLHSNNLENGIVLNQAPKSDMLNASLFYCGTKGHTKRIYINYGLDISHDSPTTPCPQEVHSEINKDREKALNTLHANSPISILTKEEPKLLNTPKIVSLLSNKYCQNQTQTQNQRKEQSSSILNYHSECPSINQVRENKQTNVLLYLHKSRSITWTSHSKTQTTIIYKRG